MVQKQHRRGSASEDGQIKTTQIHFQEAMNGKEKPLNQQQKYVQNEDKDDRNEIQERDFAPASQSSDIPSTMFNAAKVSQGPISVKSRSKTEQRLATPFSSAVSDRRDTEPDDTTSPESDPQASSDCRTKTIPEKLLDVFQWRSGATETERPRVTADEVLSETSGSSEASSTRSQESHIPPEISSVTSEELSDTFERDFSSLLSHRRSFLGRLRKVYGQSVMTVKNDRLDVNLASFQGVQLEVIQSHLLSIIFLFTYKKTETTDDVNELLESVERSRDLMEKYGSAPQLCWGNKGTV